MAQLPPGFVLDQPKPAGNVLPPGFVLDKAPDKYGEDSVGDVVKSLGTGIARGAAGLAGLPGDLESYAGGFFSGKKGQYDPFLPTTDEIKQAGTDLTGITLHEPVGRLGHYAETVGEFLPAAATIPAGGGAGLLRSVAKFGVAPGIASEAAGQFTEGKKIEPYARLAGALLAPVGVSAARRAVTPFPASADRQAMAAVLRGEGVTDLTAGQTSGSQKLRYTESELGGHRGAEMMDRQGEQFTAAALRRVGETADRAMPEVVDRAFTRIGKQFDDLAARNPLGPVDPKLADDLVGQNGVLPLYRDAGGTAPIVEKTILDIGQRLSANGVLSGDYYKATTSRLARVARETNDPELKIALQDIRSALDDAMERSIAKANPADLGAWREARRQYRDMLVIEKAATGAGENAAMGLISPSALRNATVTQGRRAYARGQGDFADLARAGEALLKPLPQSGTAPRTAVRNLVNFGPAVLGGGAGAAYGNGDWTSAMMGAALGAAAPFAAGRAMLSRPGRAYLGNNLLPPPAPQNARAALTAALLANSTLPMRTGAAQ